jgi:hypothetical protein
MKARTLNSERQILLAPSLRMWKVVPMEPKGVHPEKKASQSLSPVRLAIPRARAHSPQRMRLREQNQNKTLTLRRVMSRRTPLLKQHRRINVLVGDLLLPPRRQIRMQRRLSTTLKLKCQMTPKLPCPSHDLKPNDFDQSRQKRKTV